ncbi:MAG: hypothetical protein QOG10_2479 [Kribbellaceae bacterium]|nr:hypothetical protein [Kribbellaceae bacterium]
MSLPCYAKINADCRGRSKVSLTIRDLIALPAQAEEICEVAEAFLRQVPAVALSDEELEPQLATAQSRMGAPLPPALRWLYGRLGVSGRRLFQQDPIVHLESLMVDEDGVVTFRTEQQGCVEWGYTLVPGADPAVVIRNHMTTGMSHWEPFQSRLSVHVLEGVLSEAMFCSGTHTASLDPTPQVLEALEQLAALGIPPHPFWAAVDGEHPVRWYGHPEAVVRSDAGDWLWALGRTKEDLRRLMDRVPGDWQVVDS